MIRQFVFACVATLLAATVPTAEATDPADVLGSWTFQTKPYREGHPRKQQIQRMSLALGHFKPNPIAKVSA